jgi:hypothetical protein
MRNEAAVRGGTVLKNTGDGLLISFKSAVDAVECALSIQKGFADRAENAAFTHKIGVHIGDVIKKDGDIYGSGVNTASRLVAQCPPGGICMSSTLYELVRQKSQIGNLKVENFQVTNIEPPIKAYRVHFFHQNEPFASNTGTPKNITKHPVNTSKKSKLPKLILSGMCILFGAVIVGMQVFRSLKTVIINKNIYSFESKNFPNYFISVHEFSAYISPANNSSEYLSSTFRLVPGLVSGKDFVSLESIEYPGHYLRHQDFMIKLHRNDESDLFTKGATFKKIEGLAELSAVSFESIDWPDHFVRHQNLALRISKKEDTDLYRNDSTFFMHTPLTEHESNVKETGKKLGPEKVAFLNGHKYIFIPNALSWEEANKSATQMGGHLVTITSNEEQEFISKLLRAQGRDRQPTWLGFSDYGHEGDWRWITNEKTTFSNWGFGNPDNYEGRQHYGWIGLYGDDRWDDAQEWLSLPFIVEFENVQGENFLSKIKARIGFLN